MIQNIILIGVIALIIGAASLYVYRAKKRGACCIGCPNSAQCSAKRKCSCNCSDTEKQS